MAQCNANDHTTDWTDWTVLRSLVLQEHQCKKCFLVLSWSCIWKQGIHATLQCQTNDRKLCTGLPRNSPCLPGWSLFPWTVGYSFQKVKPCQSSAGNCRTKYQQGAFSVNNLLLATKPAKLWGGRPETSCQATDRELQQAQLTFRRIGFVLWGTSR